MKIDLKVNVEIVGGFSAEELQYKIKKVVEDYINEKMSNIVIKLAQDNKKEE